MSVKYLYYRNRIGGGLNRAKILRETDSNVWLETGNPSTMVSKKTYRTGTSWHFILYMKETNELLKEWEEQQFKLRFLKKLKRLELLEPKLNDRIKQLVIDIDISKYDN